MHGGLSRTEGEGAKSATALLSKGANDLHRCQGRTDSFSAQSQTTCFLKFASAACVMFHSHNTKVRALANDRLQLMVYQVEGFMA